MKTLLAYHMSFILVFLFACGLSVDNEKEDKNEAKDLSVNTSEIDANTIRDLRYAYFKGVETIKDEFFIKVDFVEYLTGKEAEEAEYREGAYFVDGEDTMTNITDGYYISNVDSKLKTLKLKNGEISVDHFNDDTGSIKMEDSKGLDLKLIEKYIEKQTLLILYIVVP